MSPDLERRRPGQLLNRQPVRLAISIFCLALAITAGGTLWQQQRNARVARARFDAVAAHNADQLKKRLLTYEYGLRGTRGLVIAAGFEQLSRHRFELYARSREFFRDYPGARGFGLIRRVPAAERAEFVSEARGDDAPEFEIKFLTQPADESYVIQYIEPVERNRAAIGLDVASDPVRREAAEAAMRTGRAVLTAPITLVQATSQPQRSFLLLLPIYRADAPVSTESERRAATIGWAYAPLVMDEVLADVQTDTKLALTLSDVALAGAAPFYSSSPELAAPAAGISRNLVLTINGRTWRAELSATRAFINELNLPSLSTVFGLGFATSLLLSVLTFFYAEDKQRRDEVRSEQARRAAIVEGITDAVIGETLDGLITDWNPGAERMFGFASEFAVGRAAAGLILPPERAAEDLRLCEAIAQGESPVPFETTRQRRDGQLLEVSVSVSPILDARGRRVGFAKTIRDISAAKQAEQQIRALNASLEQQVLERTAALEAARRDLKNILDAVPSLISYWDRTLRNRFANIAHRSWFQREPDELPGTHAGSLFGPYFEAMRPQLELALSGVAQTETIDLELAGRAEQKHCVVHYMPDVVAGEVRGCYVFIYDNTPQRRAQDLLARALRDNEALLATIHEHTIVSVTDANGRILDVNPHFLRASGYERDELVGQPHSVVKSGHHDRGFWEEMWRTIAAGRPWRGVIQNRRKSGEPYFVDSIVAPFKTDAGGIEKYISIGFDITASKRAEVELTKTTERIALATHAARIGIWELDVASQKLSWDDWMYRIYGRPRREVLPYAVWVHSVHPEDSERAQAEFADALAGPKPFDSEFRIVQPGGEERHIKAVAHVVRGSDGVPLRVTGVNLDITERKRAELELVATSNLLKNVLEAASEVSLVATDPNLVIKVFNGGAERMLGYRADELVNRATSLLMHDANELHLRAEELSARTGQLVEASAALVHPLHLQEPREWTYVKKDGTRLTVSLLVTAMRGDDGRLFGYLAVAHDVTRQKQYESSLQEAMRRAESANRAKSQFLANMSHEIRTPMNAVIGLSHLLAGTELDPEQSSFIAKIQVASKSLLALINDVLDLSKIEAGELVIERAAFSLQETLNELRAVFELEAQSKNIALDLVVAPGVPTMVEGDVTRLKQILTNLLSNALKFTERGHIALRVSLAEGSANSAPDLRFEVSDTGIGISSDQQARLFAPFAQADASTTRRFGGTGLGLSIVKRLTEMLGGHVELSSELGVGSTFSVMLPFDLVLTSLTPSRAAPPPLAKNALLGVRLLVVDDSEINLFVARKILQNEGAIVTAASNGRDALDRLKAKPAGYDAVLMDVQMPVMDGHEAARRIRHELGLAKLPIIALTADARTSERQQALLSGMDDFLSKPIEAPALIQCLSRYLPLLDHPDSDTDHGELRDDSPETATNWPELDGIETRDVRERLAHDRELLMTLLGCLLRDFSEIPRFPSTASEDELSGYIARVHRLRGASGQLGAKSIHELSGRIEGLCAERHIAPVPALAERLENELTRLLRSAAAVLHADALAAKHEQAVPATPTQVHHLLELLQSQSLSTLSEIRRLAPNLMALLGAERFADFRLHAESLRFGEAARILAPRPSMRAV